MDSCRFPGCNRHPVDNGLCIGHQIYKNEKLPGAKKEEAPVVKEKPKAKSQPKKKSKKQMKIDRQLKKAYAEFLARPENKYCNIQHDEECTRVATVVNHTRGRGANVLNQEDWEPACPNCNGKIEQEHAAAKEAGHKKPIHGTGEKYVRK